MIWLDRLVSRRRLYGDLSEEIREHLEEKIDVLVSRGMSREAAEAAARREFGNLTATEEDGRAVWRWRALEDFLMDVRFGLRVLRKSPGITAVTVVTLALGIAANTTVFSLLNGWMLRPPRIKDPGRVVAILTTDPAKGRYGWDQNPVAAPDFVAWREESRSFEGMAASELNTVALTGEGEPERLVGMRVSADYFQVLGVEAALGRTFLRGEDLAGRAQVVILSHGLWHRRFAADPEVVGKVLRLDGESYTVAGVMPDRFRVGYYGTQLWTPLVLPPERLLPAGRTNRSLSVLARLKPAVSAETAQAEIAALAERAERMYPGTTTGWGATAMVLQKYLADEFTVATRIQMSAVLIVLLIACANIAGLQLTRATARQTEIAVRIGLGAGRFRLIRQLMVESLLLGLAGGALGLLLAWAGVRALRNALTWGDYVREMALEISIDHNVLAYTLGISVLAALLFGLAPAFHQTAANLLLTLKDGGRTSSQGRARHRAQSALVAVQVALAVALLTGAGLMTWGFLHQIYAGSGIDPKQVLTANIRLSNARYESPSKQAAFFHDATERLEALPGVVSAGGTTALLPLGNPRVVTFSIKGHSALPRTERARAEWFSITPRFLETLRVPLLRGRGFDSHDNAQSTPVAVVNQAFARRYFPDEEALGRHLRFDTGESDRSDWSEIVGVVGNIKELSEEWEERPQVYEAYFQRPSAALTLVLRTRSDPVGLAPTLRRTIWDIDGDQPVTSVESMEQVVTRGRAAGVVVLTLLGTFAGMALAMAVVGVFGVMAYTVVQRTHEIGIRMALGARRSTVLGMVARKGLALGAWGVGIGFALAAALVLLPTGIAPDMPFDQRAGVALVAGVLLWLVVVVASYGPARHATRIDPTVALRSE